MSYLRLTQLRYFISGTTSYAHQSILKWSDIYLFTRKLKIVFKIPHWNNLRNVIDSDAISTLTIDNSAPLIICIISGVSFIKRRLVLVSSSSPSTQHWYKCSMKHVNIMTLTHYDMDDIHWQVNNMRRSISLWITFPMFFQFWLSYLFESVILRATLSYT